MLTFTIIILGGLLLWIVSRTLFPRAYIYLYASVDEWRRPVLAAYLKSDGILIDITKPRGQRRVGQVYLKEGKGIVRLYRQPDLEAEGEYEEVGYVAPEGGIFSDDEKVSTISPEGKRYWYELFLRRHADVPDDEPEPFGKCEVPLRPTPGASLGLRWRPVAFERVSRIQRRCWRALEPLWFSIAERQRELMKLRV